MDIPDIYDPEEYKALSKDVEYDLEKFKNPYVVGAMIHRLVEERKYTNAILKRILEKLEEIQIHKDTHALSDFDERILKFVKENKKVCAEDVQKAFHYKGTNGASAKLNSLHKRGFLEKVRAGKKVYFLPVT